MDTCYNMKGKYELELISTCSMKHNQLSQRSNIQTSTKMMGKNNDFRLENICYIVKLKPIMEN